MAQRTGLNENSSMSEDKKREIHSKGGKASHTTGSTSHHTSGAAGRTEAAKRGSQRS